MTSWSVYVDEYLVGSGQVAQAAIFGVETKAVWAKSADAEMSPMELEHVFGLLDPSSVDMPKEIASKVALNGKLFSVIHRDKRSFYAENGGEGVVAVKTDRCLILAYYKPDTQPGRAVHVVERVAEHLTASGF